jgi:hypothetical protein
MPELCRFFGIVVAMYAEAGEQHNLPHFHVRYGEHRAILAIGTGDVLSGGLPRPQLRLVQAWVELRRVQLEEDWNLLVKGRLPRKIAPLS